MVVLVVVVNRREPVRELCVLKPDLMPLIVRLVIHLLVAVHRLGLNHLIVSLSAICMKSKYCVGWQVLKSDWHK